MRRFVALIVCAAVAASFAPLTSASPQAEDGTILMSNPSSTSVGGVTEHIWVSFGQQANGVDGWIIELRPGKIEFTLTGQTNVPGCNLDVYFYTEDADFVSGSSTNNGCAESGLLPTTADVAVVSLRSGGNVHFTFTAT